MKRILSIAILMAVCAISAQAQLVVDSTGNVGIGTDAPTALMTVRDTSRMKALDIKTTKAQYGIYLDGNPYRTTQPTNSYCSGINIMNSTTSFDKNYGLYSYARGSGSPSYLAAGVTGQARYSAKSIGVLGSLYNTTVGDYAAIFGTVSTLPSFSYSGFYAGYFEGDVRITGTTYGTLLTPVPDESLSGPDVNRASRTVTSPNREGVMEKLKQVTTLMTLQSVKDEDMKSSVESEKINWDNLTIEEMDEADKGINKAEIKTLPQTPKATVQYSLAADQLKKVYPELVYEDKDGNVSINYIEMIPLLVQSINELSSELAELKGTSSKKVKAQTTAIEETAEDIDQVRMDQNKPNPFSGSTVISLNVPETVKQASIFIYDLSGKQIQSLPVTERGETDITVYASGLSAGMYIYTLVVDGQVKVTRRMIVML